MDAVTAPSAQEDAIPGLGSPAAPPPAVSPASPGPPARRARSTPRGWGLVLVLSLAIAAYAARYVALGERAYAPELASSFQARPWGIFIHALGALVALALGPFQFHRRLRARRPRVHRVAGRAYVVAALLTGATGVYLAWYSHGGPIAHVGFGLLGAAVVATTAVAYVRIRGRDLAAHREWMIRSFALIFAAVTLRLWQPLLMVGYGGEFTPAYLWVAWVSWVPNLVWAEVVIRRSRGPATRPAAPLPLPIG